MKFFNYFLFIAIFLFSPLSYGEWKLSRSYGDISIYKSENNTRLTVSFKNTPAQYASSIEQAVEQTASKKQQMLSMMGLEDWSISSKQAKKRKDGYKLHISGSYTDSKRRKVYFTERHYYGPRGVLQMLLTHSDPKALKKDSKESRLKSIERRYGF